MNKYKTMDANEAVSYVSYNFSEIVGIYPITPASPMAENIDIMAGNNKKNYFGNMVKVTEMQSEAGASALIHGALQGGCLATTFTASQGLLLMIPTLYKLSGEMLPAVIHVAARSLSTHALSIFGDHQDIYATRATGVCMLASSSPTEAYHMANIAHLSAIKSSLPFINFFDGFRTSHQIEKIKLIDYNKIKNLIDNEALNKFRNKAMKCSNPNTRGTAQNEDIYFQNTEVRNKYYNNAINIVEDYMNKFNTIENTNYKPFNYYGNDNAEYVIVAMGSVCGTIRETIEYLNKNNYNLGLIEVHLYRPFSPTHLLNVLPKSVKNIAVLDRTKEPGSSGEPLYLDIVSALNNLDITIIGGRYGLSSKNTTPKDIKAVYDYLMSSNPRHNFTIGIHDDITNLSLKVDNNFKIPNKNTEFLIYGYGSDGMVSTSKDIIKIIGDHTDNNVQGYFQYDSKKSGGVTRSHIKISKDPILGAYYVEDPTLIVISKDSYIYKYDIIDKLKEEGTILLNTNLNEKDLINSLPKKVRYLLAKKKAKLYTIDAYKIANELGLKNKINTCLEICIFDIIKIINTKEVKDIIKENNVIRFKSKGDNIIKINNDIVDNSLKYINIINLDPNDIKLTYEEDTDTNFFDIISNLNGDSLPVSSFEKMKDGIYEGGSTAREKREIAENVPCWIKDNCIQCNRCAFVCPHAVIRPFLTNKRIDQVESIESLFPKDKHYSIAISYKDCTGCGLCVQNCPGKMGNKALKMVNYNSDKFNQKIFDYLLKNNDNEHFQSKILNVKNIGFKQPKFEFNGACAGCGETIYLKNLTQFFDKNLMIANATGCSSIYGASLPSTPYSIPWASSLFEDNAEYGLGIYQSINLKRDKIEDYMKDYNNELFNEWINNKNNYEICKKIEDNIDYKKHNFLLKNKEYITPKSIWIVGGDGFAYDIGYGGLDHVLSTNNNINILILDTEVYSNTGGQSSKSSNMGSIASFTAKGKNNYKKDLARIAMCYPHVYVATTNIGYDKEQYLKVLKEANEHIGPSIVIAYSPCIEHGIKSGMEHSLDNAYLATECGYFLTFRYNPDNKKFILDSKNINFEKYDDYLSTETRFNNLKKVNKEQADELLYNQKKWAINRYNYYKNLEN